MKERTKEELEEEVKEGRREKLSIYFPLFLFLLLNKLSLSLSLSQICLPWRVYFLLAL